MSRFRNIINKFLYSLQSGDKSKQRELYDYTYNNLKIIALKYAIDKNDYEDILVEAYIRAFKYVDTADLNKDGYNWLCKIVQNVAYDFNKKIEPTVPLDEISFTKIFGDEIDKIISKDDVLKQVCQLSEYEQRLIHLKFYEDMSYAEIAKILNSKKSTVHKQTLSVLNKIKGKLK